MKLRFRSYTLGTAILSLATLAFAPNAAAEPFNAGSYWHFKAAALSIDGGDTEAVQLGIDFGFQFPKGIAFEVGAHRTVYAGFDPSSGLNCSVPGADHQKPSLYLLSFSGKILVIEASTFSSWLEGTKTVTRYAFTIL